MKHLFLLVLATPLLASTIVYSNFGPSQSYAALGINVGNGTVFGSGFSPTATGILESISLPLFTRLDTTAVSNLTVGISEGIPNAISFLELWTVSASSLSTASITTLTLQSLVHPILASGTLYYLTIFTLGDEVDGTFSWAKNNMGDAKGVTSFNHGNTFSSPGAASGAFEIQANVDSVPEPSTLLLTASAAGVLWWRRRR
ncbi:PEP-CTERM sorting domain-containing protein [Bryobacter aggregatus]|uniref:PEP-CTERM sorting domain-containing protein n=1 Tax=Bryobacter aggregatus TaxID=360054 RepID=UPI0004E1FB0D|nr:PEP-CTERM sorting domain-containing protein [Bryobacter aggregatus]